MFGAKGVATTGIKNQQRRLDTIANNLANVNTTGFRGSRLDFKEALYTAGIVPGPPRTPAPEGNQQRGNGVALAAIAREIRPGAIVMTGRDLDLAIEGEGFFAFDDGEGNTVYSRNGNLQLGVLGGTHYLTSANGKFLLSSTGGRIPVPAGTSQMTVDTNGTIRFSVGEEELGTATVGVFTFANALGLYSLGDTVFEAGEVSGEAVLMETPVVRQSALEGSNVDLSEEFTRMIRTQRAFQLASRALTTADEMEGIANNMRR